MLDWILVYKHTYIFIFCTTDSFVFRNEHDMTSLHRKNPSLVIFWCLFNGKCYIKTKITSIMQCNGFKRMKMCKVLIINNKTLINASIFLNFWEIVISASISMYMYVWRFKTSLCASCSSVNSHGRISRHINLTDIHQVKHSCRKWSMSSKYYGTRKTRVLSINISLEKAHIFFKELV